MSIRCQKSLSKHSELNGMPLHSLDQYGAALGDVLSKYMKSVLATHGLTNLDFATIRLFLTDEQWTVSELSLILSIDGPAMSRVAGKLVDKGILKRRRPKEDRRVVFLKLTEAGVSLGLKLHDKLHSYEGELLEGVPPEHIRALRLTIKQILQNRSTLDQATETIDSVQRIQDTGNEGQ